MRSVSTLAEGLGHPQGPDIAPDGSIVFAETYIGRIARYRRGEGVTTLLDTGGGPNAVLYGRDGSLYFTENGGQAGVWRSPRQRTPSLQVLLPGSDRAEVVATEAAGAPFLAPHDLAWGPDDTLYMTDSGTWDPQNRPDDGRIITLSPSGEVRVLVRTGPVFPSGLGVASNGDLYWCECYTNRIYRLPPDGAPELVCILPPEHLPESLFVGPDDTLWLASLFSGGVVVVDTRGNEVDFISTGGLPLNCVSNGSSLFVADLGDYDDDAPEDEAQVVGRLLEVSL